MGDQDFEIINRNNVVIEVTVLDQAGIFVDLTNMTVAVLTVKVNKDDPDIDAVLQVDMVGGQITVISALIGKLQIELSDSDTDIAAARYFYDLVLTIAGEQFTVLYGELNVLERIKD